MTDSSFDFLQSLQHIHFSNEPVAHEGNVMEKEEICQNDA